MLRTLDPSDADLQHNLPPPPCDPLWSHEICYYILLLCTDVTPGEAKHVWILNPGTIRHTASGHDISRPSSREIKAVIKYGTILWLKCYSEQKSL